MDPSGFPELLEYTIKLADHNTLNLQLQLDRSLQIPPSAIQKADGHLENKEAPKTVLVFYCKVALLNIQMEANLQKVMRLNHFLSEWCIVVPV